MIPLRFASLLLIAFAGLALEERAALAQGPDDQVKRVEAGMLYSLGALIRSSRTVDDGTFVIGVLGKDPFDGEDAAGRPVNHLAAMAKESNARAGKDKRKKIVIKKPFPSAKDYERCHLLIVSANALPASAEKTAPERMKAAKAIAVGAKDGAPVLVVADAKQGAPVGFMPVDIGGGGIEVRLELNVTIVKETGFDKISASLYTVARNNGWVINK